MYKKSPPHFNQFHNNNRNKVDYEYHYRCIKKTIKELGTDCYLQMPVNMNIIKQQIRSNSKIEVITSILKSAPDSQTSGQNI